MLELYKTNSTTAIEGLQHLPDVIFVIVDYIYQEVTPAYIKNQRNRNYCLINCIFLLEMPELLVLLVSTI